MTISVHTKKGDRVRHLRTEECGVITHIQESYNPRTRESNYLVTVQGDDGRVWFANDCALGLLGRMDAEGRTLGTGCRIPE
jgi:hypothetical protein